MPVAPYTTVSVPGRSPPPSIRSSRSSPIDTRSLMARDLTTRPSTLTHQRTGRIIPGVVMTTRPVWHLRGPPVSALIRELPSEFEPRPLLADTPARRVDEDGVLLIDLEADALDAAEAAALRLRLPVVGLVASGAANAPLLACHAYLQKPVPSFV